MTAENLVALEVLSEVALGLILFSVGSVFQFSRFRRLGRQFLYLTLAESVLAALIVTVGVLAAGQPWQVAALLGSIAIATAPASTLMVVRECDSEGPLTDNLLGIIGVNNLLCISVYTLVAATIDLGAGLGGGSIFDAVYRAVFPLVWQLAGSAALGYLVGLMLAGWSTQVTETGEILILLAGSILLCVGVARFFDLSPLVASLAVGATTLVPTMGVVGLVYVFGRAFGKFVGAVAGSRWLKLDVNVQRFLGFGLMAQAGLAVGLTIAIEQRTSLSRQSSRRSSWRRWRSSRWLAPSAPASPSSRLVRRAFRHQRHRIASTCSRRDRSSGPFLVTPTTLS